METDLPTIHTYEKSIAFITKMTQMVTDYNEGAMTEGSPTHTPGTLVTYP